jgi:hypothetical protein
MLNLQRRMLIHKYQKILMLLVSLFLVPCSLLFAQGNNLFNNNIVWTSQSKNSSESMPCGGGDIGLNVWVENNEIYAYLSRSGTFDENNTLLKLGRVKLKLSPNPFAGKNFRQELLLKDGYVKISGSSGKLIGEVKVWVDVFKPVIHFEVKSNQKVNTKASYQSWRFDDRITKGRENNQNSYKWAPQGVIKTYKDSVTVANNQITFYHQNKDYTIFDVTVKQQGFEAYSDSLFNPLKGLIFGGLLYGENMISKGIESGQYLNVPYKAWNIETKQPSTKAHVIVKLSIENNGVSSFKANLAKLMAKSTADDFIKTTKWWNDYWNRSFISISSINSAANQVGQNYQLFRYMLGCNAFGKWPTKFNGGLFTYDPALTDSTQAFTPDFRNWGGGIHTAQNQRLVYWPMLKSGDFSLMKPQFDFYLNLLKTAQRRTEVYWGHKGANFNEQIENFGFSNPAEYAWKRPIGFDPGMEYNAWLEYEWDTVFEFCMMILETERYNKKEIKTYIPLIESCLTFFQEHYTQLAKQRGAKALDANGHLVLYPGSSAETYKMAYNSTSTIAALSSVLKALIASPSLKKEQKEKWEEMLKTIPPISYREFQGKTTIAPAKLWERINNTETPQLYPVFPWGIYGVGKPGLDTAINTYKYDTDALKFRSHIGWKQDQIFAARLGLTDEAAHLIILKLQNSGRRFPAFWGPGYDWVPDHNWGGSGMIGLQEMLLQDAGKKLYLFPAWPKEWDVHFKLYAPYQTIVEGKLKNGKLEYLKVTPESRITDVVNMLERN